MGTKSVKGLMKGIRNIFDVKEQEEGMQIGFPTDVKHVAHIGWDGPAAVNNTASWMGDYQALNSGPLNNGSIGGSHELGKLNCSSQETDNGENGSKDLSPKASRRSNSSDKEGGSTSGVPKQSRRHHHSGSSPARESSTEESRRARRERRASGGSGDSDSSTSTALQEAGTAPGIPKTRRRKAKEAKGSKEGSTTSSRTSKGGSEQLKVKEEKEGDQ